MEADPNNYENDEAKYKVLKLNNTFRLEILQDILAAHLGMIVLKVLNKTAQKVYKSAYFLGRHENKFELLDKLKSKMLDREIIDCGRISIKFYGKNENPDTASELFLPILLHSCPEDFSTVLYFDVSTNTLKFVKFI